ncbi:MAG: biotin/lipoyl-binding protein [Bacteroidales bacterium]|nr:biotin/lipoyl-binding protein [Bacteroidales bacterium]MBN2774795.1 biotin/lipoyl-binding protein [Prolixibacteraceae bacterium]
MKKYKFKINGISYEVQIKDLEDNIARIEVNGTSYKVELEKEIRTSKTPKLIRKPIEQQPNEGHIIKQSSSGLYEVRSPLPGTILKVNISVGDSVVEGQNLIVMEAMKMENQVQSLKSGTVKKIKVKSGDTVMQDDILIEIEQPV